MHSKRFSLSRSLESEQSGRDAGNQTPQRGDTSKPRVATSGSAPWVTVEEIRQPQRGCTSRCGTPSGFDDLVSGPTEGGTAEPLTLGCVFKPLRSSQLIEGPDGRCAPGPLIRKIVAALLASVLLTTANASADSPKKLASPRKFLFRYHVTITNLPAGKKVDVWIPLATSDAHQTVKRIKTKLPGKPRVTRDKDFGNAMLYVRVVADAKGRFPIAIDYEVERKTVSPANGVLVKSADRKQFLKSNRLVPLRGKPFEKLFDSRLLGTTRADVRKIYDRVDKHVRYHKPEGGKWGRGDADWVCDSRYGNCSDFHSLFISLCRTNRVPARFRIGFPVAAKKAGKVGGYHCWAEFADRKRWIPVDISEADKNPKRKNFYFGNLPADRVMFTTGRDLRLEPRQKSGPLNFFIYPHVEVDGKRHTKLEKQFSFAEIQ